MKRIALTLTALTLIGLLIGAPRAYAQAGASLTAAVDRTELTTDDTLTLTLTLQTPDGRAPRLTLPAIDGLSVVGSGMSSQLSSLNGATTARVVYTYQMQPTHAGTFTIPALRLDWNGEQLSTDQILLTVLPGTGKATNTAPAASATDLSSPTGNQDFFVKAGVDKNSAYVGEPVKYTLRLYSTLMLMGEPDYQAPKLAGFWHTQKPETQQYTVMADNGTQYDVTELTTWLFPTSAGQATIDPATIAVPGGFFSSDAQAQSDPIAITVKPLPAGAPADFNGAVGQFQIKATPDRTTTRLGEPITLRVELSGTGNWGTLGDPHWPTAAQWRAYDNQSKTDSHFVNGQYVGTRTYERLLTPSAEGKLTLPAIHYAYFDPATAQYQTISTDPIQVEVAPGNPNVAISLPKNPATAASDQTATSTAPRLKPAPREFTSAAKPLTQQVLFGLLFIVPVGLVAGDLVLGYRKRHLAQTAAQRRRARALKRAQRHLKHLRRNDQVHLETERIVRTYLEDKMQQPLGGLAHSTLAQDLSQQAVSPAVAQRVIAMLYHSEASEFGQQEPLTHDELKKSTAQLLLDLDKELSA